MTVTAQNPLPTSERPLAFSWGKVIRIGIYFVVGVLIVVAAATTQNFFTASNGVAILSATSIVGIAAVGLTFLTLSGSVASLATSQTVSALTIVFFATQFLGLIPALVITILGGILFSALQGAMVGYWNANPIVLSIAAGFAVIGFITLYTGGISVIPANQGFKALNATPLGIPLSVFVLVGLTILAELVLRRTTIGRQIYLVGENRSAARAAGLPIGRVSVFAWAVFGGFLGINAAFISSLTFSASPTVAGNLTFDAIAAVLVGGTAIAGGKGSAVRTLFGAILIAIISNILLLRGVSTGAQIFLKGLLVLAIVLYVQIRMRRG